MSQDIAERIDQLLDPTRASERLTRLYREIGLAAIACEFDIDIEEGGVPAELSDDGGQGELAA